MKRLFNVQSDTKPLALEINIDTVYSRSNIHSKETEERTVYEYDEIQYTMVEYLRDALPKTEKAIAELTNLVAEQAAEIEFLKGGI